MKTISTLGLLLCATVAAVAHDMYIMPSTFRPTKGARITSGFHVGDSFPDSEVGGRIEKLQSPRLIWKGGSAPFTNLRVEGNRDLGDATVGGSGEIVVAVNTSPTLIELEPAKFTDYLKEEGLAEIIKWREQHGESSKPGKERFSKYAKSILVSGDSNGFANHSVGFAIEIIPEADPYTLKVGELLPVRVLFRGKPAPDVQIESAWAGSGQSKTTVIGRTGADGRVKVPVPAAGRWRIHTIKMERCAEPAVADWESFWASLTFEVQ